ncbi:MAG TPA: hypothetical protein VI728_06220 [Syntrophales bacterium]|nr:hypothetical protein [Syntrophales bacterium]
MINSHAVMKSYSAPHTRINSSKDIVKTAFIALALVGLSFWLQGNIGLNLADEGFLWYGTLHTADGQVPLRDFQSYDPGRYYWGALWSYVLGDGIMALRASTAIFQALGLFLGLLAARRVIRSYWLLALFGLLLVVWMHPRHKLFEPAIALSAVFFAVRLIERPELARYFLSGVFIGLAAFFGRNHGLYLFSAFAAIIVLIRFKLGAAASLRKTSAWLAGIAVGFFPMVLMFIFVPGFLSKYIEWAFLIMRVGANLSLPIPLPWNDSDLYSLSMGLLFISMPLLFISGFIWALASKEAEIKTTALFISSAAVGIFYMHHAFARADIGHLAQAIHPFLLSVVALPALLKGRARSFSAILAGAFLLLTAAFTISRETPCLMKAKGDFVQYEIGGDSLWISRDTASQIESVKAVAAMAGPQEGIFIAPHWPTMYCILGRQSPLWQIYFVFPEMPENEKKMIEELNVNNVQWVILGDIALDGRDELRFRNTHPLMWKYFNEDFRAVQGHGLPEGYELFKRQVFER